MPTVLNDWLNITDHREARRFLEAHRELLDSRSGDTLEHTISEVQGHRLIHIQPVTSSDPLPKAKDIQWLRDHLYLLRAIGVRGGTVKAIREAYVNAYAGFALDLPPWLEEQENQLSTRRLDGTTNERVVLLREAIVHARNEPNLAQEILAELNRLLWDTLNDGAGVPGASTQEEQLAGLEAALQVYTLARYPLQYGRIQGNLGNAYRRRKDENRHADLEEAIVCYNRALRAFALDSAPIQYAKTQYNLGLTYTERIEGEWRTNLEKAITCYTNALQVYTPDAFPVQYATLQHHLGIAYYQRVEGEQQSNLGEAIAHCTRALQVFTLDGFPVEYARTQHTLGNVYSEWLIGGQEAISCYTRALQVFTLDNFPAEYALVQYNLGTTYKYRKAGERQANQEAAISCYISALQASTLDAFPSEYAKVQYRLGGSYRERLGGDRLANLEEAIACYKRALQVYTPDTFPSEYADTQNDLGTTYGARLLGERHENLEEAIACYTRALQIYTLDEFPSEYARTQYNLGLIYRERIKGERRANLEAAIACHMAALHIYAIENFPVEYARIQHNLGVVYHERIEGERHQNLEESIACYTRALQVFTLEAFPVDYARSQNNLCIVYSERIAGDRRTNVEKAIAHALRALQVYTLEGYPVEYAAVQFSLGIAYRERIAGERRANLEEAITYYTRALQVYTRQAFPMQHAKIQNNLSFLYRERLMGERQANLEEAITCCTRSLQVYTFEMFPVDYAMVQNNLGAAYDERIEGERKANLEKAIACYKQALQIYTLETFPKDYALTQNNLGNTYWIRLEGEKRVNLEEAIACYKRALQVYTRDAFPVDYARTQNNLGTVYIERGEGEREDNLEKAMTCFKQAAQVYTLDAFPIQHRMTQLNRAYAEIQSRRWEDAHEAYSCALAAEDLLLGLGAGVVGRDAVLKEGRDAAVSNGFALVRLSRFAEAAEAIEHGRARGLADSIALDIAHPDLISNPERRARYEHARNDFIAAQAALHDPPNDGLDPGSRRTIDLERTRTYHQAKALFDTIIDEIRQAQDPADFLDTAIDAGKILHAAECCGQDHALVYLAATPWGGFALIALSPNPARRTESRFVALALPQLTEALINDLVESRMEYDTLSTVINGGFAWAQEGNAYRLLPATRADQTFRERASALQEACAIGGKTSMLALAAQEILNISELADIVDRPLNQVSTSDFKWMTSTLGHFFLRYELKRCLDTLAEVAVRPLAAWLSEEGARSITLIPCGLLAAFPLVAVEVIPGKRLNELFVTSVAPSARSLLRQANKDRGGSRTGVYTLGNPEPKTTPLDWGEAEALTLALLARALKLPAKAKVQNKATRNWLMEMLQKGFVVDASCHGIFNVDAPLQSSLRLARGEALTLGHVLSREVDLQGLRLLILSACQTAILDLRGVRDEVYSLAVGMLQAGAKAVLAALWSVDDRATYLLMVRFAQEWFPHMHSEPPAAALARAQRWLRTVTIADLLAWQTLHFPSSGIEEKQKVSSGESDYSSWEKKMHELALLSAKQPIEANVRVNRYDADEAVQHLHNAARYNDPDVCPYEDPIYWAGFQITGW